MDKILKVFIGEVKEINEEERTLTALVSTGAIDRDGESLISDGANLANYKKNPVVMWAHRYGDPPIGKNLWIKKTDDGILAKTQFAKTAFADEIFELYKGKFLKAWSVGFVPDKDAIEEDLEADGKKKPRRIYNKWELLEYSAVPVPANPEALTQAVEQGMIKTKSLVEDLGITIKEKVIKCENCSFLMKYEREPEVAFGEMGRDIKCPGCEAIINQEGVVVLAKAKETPPEPEPQVKTGAVLNKKNIQSLKDAQSLIQKVLDSAEPQEESGLSDEDEVILMIEEKKKEEKKEPFLRVEGSEIAGEKLKELVESVITGAVRKLRGKV